MAERYDNITSFPGGAGPVKMPRARMAESIEATDVTWLSPGRLAAGKITIMDGDPGLGKSQITIDWAARLTRGEPLPGMDGWPHQDPVTSPKNVILISSEDGESDTIRPRLDAAGADTRRVFLMDMVDEQGSKYAPMLGSDLWAIERQIEATNAVLVVVDPLMAHLDANVKANSDQDVRGVFSPVAAMAERTGCAVLVLRHLNKAQGLSSLYRGGGSIGIIGAARVGLMVHKDTDDETGQRRLLMVQKCNIGPELESLAYQVEPTANGSSRIKWLGYSSKTVQGVMGQPLDQVDREDTSDCELWLSGFLEGGPVATVEVNKQAAKEGFGTKALKRAKTNLGVKAQKKGFGTDGQWNWYLPEKRPSRVVVTPRLKSADDPFDDD